MATHTGSTGNDNIVIKNRTPLVPGYNITATSGSVTPNGNFSDTTLTVNAGDGNDTISAAGLTTASGVTSIILNGEGGNDTITGGAGNDSITVGMAKTASMVGLAMTR